jgi:alanine racemase
MTTPPELAAATMTINLATLANNWRTIARRVSPAECGATIKADGYGCGAVEVAKALWGTGCKTFFVAVPMEGVLVRDTLPDAVIYVLDGLFAGQADFYIAHDLRPCLVSLEEIAEWADTTGGRHKAAVHVDTGINRLGLDQSQAVILSNDQDLMSQAGLCLVMSHLASGDDETDAANEAQRDRFRQVLDLFPALPGSLANSPGTYLGPDYAHDIVRPGVALFGGNPFAGRENELERVVSLTAPVLQIRDVAAGEGVGYGATWTADRQSRIAIIGVGYADGLIRAMSWPAMSDGSAKVFLAGQMAPIVGRVSMDMITVDVTDIAATEIVRGTQVELLGQHVSVDDWAKWAGTIPYEILTSLGRRYAKVYFN